MKNLFYSISILVGMAAISSAAQAEPWYVGVNGMVNLTHDGDVNGAGDQALYELGYGASAAVGMYFNPNLRLEGELSYRANDIDTIGGGAVLGDVGTVALLANLFYDFSPNEKINPHLGGGIGVADVDYQVDGNAYSDTVVALQLGAGIDYDLGNQLAATLDYRLFVTDDLAIGGGAGMGEVEYWNSSLLVGIRKKF